MVAQDGPRPEPANDNEKLVVAFLDGWGPTYDVFRNAYDTYLTDDVLWENTGFPTVAGKQEAMAFLDQLRRIWGMEYCSYQLLAIASRGDKVLTERIDKVHGADGSVKMTFKIMGAFDIRDGKIARYSDHFDSQVVHDAMQVSSAAGS
jgi:limonene-1,2-epoxide hydrolase